MGSALLPSSRRVVVIALLVVLAPFGTTVAAAQSAPTDPGTIVVEEGETVDRVDGFAGAVVVRGTVTGDVSAVAGSIRIAETGTVEGNLDGSAGAIVVAGTVNGDVQVGGGSFELTDTGRIGGDLEAGAAYIGVDGTIDGNVKAGGGSVTIGPNANVGGEFRYDAGEFSRSPDAVVEGGVVQDPSLSMDGDTGPDTSFLPSWVGTVYSLLASLLFGVVLLAVLPRFSTSVASNATDTPLKSGGVGLLALVGAPVVLVLLAITIVGIPLMLVGVGLFVLAIWAAVVYGQFAVGTWVLGLADRENRWLALVVGLVGFALIGTIPIVGALAEFVVFLLGLGALALALRELYGRDEATEPATS
jgi:cytoskeletal protein CcmA (bactofilin family)